VEVDGGPSLTFSALPDLEDQVLDGDVLLGWDHRKTDTRGQSRTDALPDGRRPLTSGGGIGYVPCDREERT
jgi:hypothetical protein